RSAMGGANGDGFAGFRLPVGGKGGVVILVEFTRRIIGHVEKRLVGKALPDRSGQRNGCHQCRQSERKSRYLHDRLHVSLVKTVSELFDDRMPQAGRYLKRLRKIRAVLRRFRG